MASSGEKEMSWKSRLGLIAQSSSSKGRGKGNHCVLSWCHCQRRGGAGVGLIPKETRSQMDGEWDINIAGIVGELQCSFVQGRWVLSVASAWS